MNIDHLANKHSEKRAELAEVRRQILESVRASVIIFVDLVGSTALKQRSEDDEWLVGIFDFIQRLGQLSQENSGTLVKRMGDGVLITFAETNAAERFIDSVGRDQALRGYSFKMSVDFGEVYFFRFEDKLNDDPYGTAVDRCARLLDFAAPGAILCGAGFYSKCRDRAPFFLAGKFKLRGLIEPEEIYIRILRDDEQSEKYLKPLIDSMNSKAAEMDDYRRVGRKYSISDFVELTGSARPFLMRELLNLPKLPLSAAQLRKKLQDAEYPEENLNYYGMLVEWELIFERYSRYSDSAITVSTKVTSDGYHSVDLALPKFMLDAVRLLRKDDKIEVRGVITKIFPLTIELDYVDFNLVKP